MCLGQARVQLRGKAADILLRNDNGAAQVWLMNGTSITATAALPNAGTSWHPNTG